ncbi:hypothetical protein C7S20_02655 [Christiangramia fulva]|uniref:Outer membrane protein beta-barrel domain-containing protein n=1 Tax=Christiangramia fulva TaxID=2126553 RepID=A0A2R3Z1X9_9FLAO|nr:outer membrane beta-barrel protein [Christiangramia fulva]AVR44249.1 hypothetical protein C7S20_02655 [Christiangramia fulva]
MKKLIFLFLLYFVFYNNYAQESNTKTRLGLDLFLENTISSERIQTGENVGYFADYDKTNFQIGLQVERYLNNKITLNSGLNYSNRDFTGTYFCQVCDFSLPPEPEEIKFQFLEIPLSLKYYFFRNNFRPFIDLGLINQFAIKNEITEKKYVILGKTGVGLDYNFNSNASIQVLFNYNRAITKMFEESDFKPEVLSIGIGFRRRL